MRPIIMYRFIERPKEHWMDERWRAHMESYVHRECRFVRWGIETPWDGETTWQVYALALLLPWAVLPWFQ